MQKSLIMKTLEPPNLKGDSTFSQIYLQEHHQILMMEGERYHLEVSRARSA